LLRRGLPTLNARWAPPATVLTGDFLFARAAKLAAEADHLPLMKSFADTLATIVNGELTQMFNSRGLVNRDDYYKRIYAKTASLFEMTARAAAMVSPVEETTVEAMRDFGYSLGMAFQIVDDILDFTGDEAAVGKPLGSDLLNGLVTLPAIYFAESHPSDPVIQSLPGGGWTNQENITRLINNIRSSDAIRKAMGEANGYIDRALAHLEVMPPCTERDALENLAKYIVDRSI
ncbi:MAG TPA: polyprenyl synthetase family protein, partial [Anaerolineales bacterium]